VASSNTNLCVLAIYFFLLCSYSFTLLAQNENTPNQWWAEVGYMRTTMLDEHSSPLLYRADMLSFRANFQRSSRLLFECDLHFQLGNNQAPAVGRRKGTFYEPIDFTGQKDSYDFIVNPLLSRLDGQFSVRIHYPLSDMHQIGLQWTTRYSLAGAGGDAMQFAHSDLAPSYRLQLASNRGLWQATFALPLLGVVTRPNFAYDASLPDETNYFRGYLRTGTRLVSLGQFFNPRFTWGYQWTRLTGRTLGLIYRAQWLNCNFPRRYRQIEQGIHLQYHFR